MLSPANLEKCHQAYSYYFQSRASRVVTHDSEVRRRLFMEFVRILGLLTAGCVSAAKLSDGCHLVTWSPGLRSPARGAKIFCIRQKNCYMYFVFVTPEK